MRYNGGGQKTNYRYTGQHWDQGHGLYWFNNIHEFTGGSLAEWAYVNMLQATAALAAQPNESAAATVGRHATNAVAMVQGAEEMVAGAGLIGGGAAACVTGVLAWPGRQRADHSAVAAHAQAGELVVLVVVGGVLAIGPRRTVGVVPLRRASGRLRAT